MKTFSYRLLAAFNLFICFTTNAQEGPFGIYFDNDDNLIYNYIDIDYNPISGFSKKHGTTYKQKGSYTDKTGKKHTGQVAYIYSNSMKFTYDSTNKTKRIYADKVVNFTAASDSFVTVKNFILETKLGAVSQSSSYFIKYLTSFNDTSFYIFTKPGMQNKPIINYLYQKQGDKTIHTMPVIGKKLFETCMTLFGSLTQLHPVFEKAKSDDIIKYISTYDYFTKYRNNTKTYLSKFYNETKAGEPSEYYYTVNMVDDKWEISYYTVKDEHLFYQKHLSIEDPYIKRGAATYYYNNGTVRARYNYANDGELDFITHYHPETGNKVAEIVCGKKERKYIKAYNDSGEQVIDSLGNGNQVLYDKVNDRQIYITYKKHTATEVYNKNSADEITLMVDKKQFKFYPTLLRSRIQNIPFHNNLFEMKFSGIIVMKLRYDEKGALNDFALLNSPDDKLEGKLKRIISANNKEIVFLPKKHNDVKVPFELVVPLKYEASNTNPINHSHGYHHNMMMMNQLMQMGMPGGMPMGGMPGGF